MNKTPLGEPTDYPAEYSPQVLFAVPRIEARKALGLGDKLPFQGEDIWNAWELTWLEPSGKPVVATAVITVPANSANIVESKSLKLYLNSLAMSRYASIEEITGIISRDLSRTTESQISVRILPARQFASGQIVDLPGKCIDDLDLRIESSSVDASFLKTVGEDSVEEELHSHLLRSNCPVTNQPDMGSVLIRYRGPAVDREFLLRYIVSLRRLKEQAVLRRLSLEQ